MNENRLTEKQLAGLPNLLTRIVRYGVYFVLFTPLIVSSKFYFPFVGPKSIYFMALVEIVFFAWLILAIFYKEYRPRKNLIFLALILFLAILAISSVLGVNPSNSFWSKFERMTGLLMWFHLFAFFLVTSSVFRKKDDWYKNNDKWRRLYC